MLSQPAQLLDLDYEIMDTMTIILLTQCHAFYEMLDEMDAPEAVMIIVYNDKQDFSASQARVIPEDSPDQRVITVMLPETLVSSVFPHVKYETQTE